MLAPQQLDPLVSRIALYPDPLLAQILPRRPFRLKFQMPQTGPTSMPV